MFDLTSDLERQDRQLARRRQLLRDVSQAGNAAHLPPDRAPGTYASGCDRSETRERGAISLRAGLDRAEAAEA